MMISIKHAMAPAFAVALAFGSAVAENGPAPRSGDEQMEAQTHDETAKYIHRDFAALLWPKSRFLGFIGADYQRLKIVFTAISHDTSDPPLYHVKGYSAVRGNHCEFEGTIRVAKLVTWSTNYPWYEEYADLHPRAIGEFRAAYEFREDKAQPSTGVFKGRMALDWYIDKDGQLLYDDVSSASDGYSNNTYEGTWTSYKSGQTKTANWGEFRIPGSGDLDTGAGEFLPNDKYKKNGWDDPEWSPQPKD
jgi:hypothetical protein